MSFFLNDDVSTLTINKMIFHIVGKGLTVPVLLNEISPPVFTDFFLERIKTSLNGNMFEFLPNSNTERILRIIHNDADQDQNCFSTQSKILAGDFQAHHRGNASQGAFFIFELLNNGEKYYALVKYDNDEVVRYMLNENTNIAHVPRLEKFSESFVRKAEAMQKIALVKLDNNEANGGKVAVIDRSKRSNISEYFEGFLNVKRINDDISLTEKLIDVLKKVFKENKGLLPEDIVRSGINGIYEKLRRVEFVFDTSNPRVNLVSIFGQIEDDSPVEKTFIKESKNLGIFGESFTVRPINIDKPKRRRIETTENVVIIYDDDMPPVVTTMADGRTEIKIVTTRITLNDIDTQKTKGGN
ncbi:nucleoid-associated protein [Serratia proteamaculans]|uniref:nucleoid-associated protein n=1 Tax=Serratia proteamaculans TaxID=28151 RepID=UPI0039BDCCA2